MKKLPIYPPNCLILLEIARKIETTYDMVKAKQKKHGYGLYPLTTASVSTN